LPAENYYSYLRTDGTVGMVTDLQNAAEKRTMLFQEKKEELENMYS
jgi:hypothetical protein